MFGYRPIVRGAAALVCAALAAACSDSKDLVMPEPPVDPLFRSYVALGNSITAGFQSAGINDSTQAESYAALLAQQMGTRFVRPRLAGNGCPPPLENLATGARVGGGSATDCALRADAEGVAVINNVAVPGATSGDPADPMGSGAANILTTLILGGKTQVARALEADPTFVSIWIGNNDALGPALTGVLTDLTSPDAFEANYTAMLDGLTASPSLEGGVLIGVVNVAGAPIFFPGAALQDPQLRGAINAVTGKTVTIDTSCTPTTQSLINFQIIDAIARGAAPDTIACHVLTGHESNQLGNVYVLEAAELGMLTTTVNAYNAFIQAKAEELGWAYLDPNPALEELRGSGQIPPFPNLAEPTKPFGDFISLDGIHPARAAHRLLANLLIEAINAKYATSIPALQ